MSRSVLASVLMGWALLSGCINQDPMVISEPVDPTVARLRLLRMAYCNHLQEKEAPPKSFEDFKPDLANLRKHYDCPEDLLVSPRDGKPFGFCWGVDVAHGGAGKGATVYVYEKEGSGGSRYVLAGRDTPRLFSDAEFREAHFPPGQSPAQ